MTTLQERFEEKFGGYKKANLSPKQKIFSLLEKELEVDLDGFSNRARLTTEDLYTVYRRVVELKDAEVEYLYNGRDVIPVSEYREMREDDSISDERLKRLWGELGSDE